MSEFYHKDIFGEVIDLDVGLEEEETLTKASARNFEFSQIFALTDAVGERRKKDAWILYRKAIASGQVPEQLFYKVLWVVKTMLLAKRTKVYTETDMKEFPYKKAKSFLKNWQDNELEKLSEALVIGYHEVRRGGAEMEMMLERILLNL